MPVNQTPLSLNMDPLLWWNMVTREKGPMLLTTSSLDKMKTCEDGLEEKKIESLMEEIRKNGLKKPLIIFKYQDSEGNCRFYVGEGNHRLEAMKRLGSKGVPVEFKKSSKDHEKSQDKNSLSKYSLDIQDKNMF